MAMKPCKECGKEISAKAKLCPHCGEPDPTRRALQNKMIGFVIVGGPIILAIVMGLFDASSETADPRFMREDLQDAIRSWVVANPEHGAVSRMSPEVDWAQGPRMDATTSTGRGLEFYFVGDSIVSVYREDGIREKVWPPEG